MMSRFSIVLLLLSLLAGTQRVVSLGGEIAVHTVPQMTANVTYRQDLCDRYKKFLEGEIELKDALAGLQLNVVMGTRKGARFNYDPVTGIDTQYPGLQAVILDELAKRGDFTWRDSFGVFGNPTNETWTELLTWTINTFDVSVDWWTRSLDRMNLGAAFLQPWYDSSAILLKKDEPYVEVKSEIVWFNWLRPYEPDVWVLTLITIVWSALVHQWLELLGGGRGNRTMWEWFQQNLYLSAINFTQAYEYQPKSLAGRLFGVSMAVWALVMTATYTANLASLLVERQSLPPPMLSLAEASVFGKSVCTVGGTVSDQHIQKEYPDITRIPQKTGVDMYAALRRGDCDFAMSTVSSWANHEGMKKFNPNCDISWVGGDQKVYESSAGFAVKAASGGLCTSLVRDVLDYHMEAIVADGFLAMAWDRENEISKEINCDVYRPEAEESNGGRRLDTRSRSLKSNTKGAAGGAVASMGGGEEGSKLTMEQMLGTFISHWLMMTIAVGIAIFNHFHERHLKKHTMKAIHTIDHSLHLNTVWNTIGESQVVKSVRKSLSALELQKELEKDTSVALFDSDESAKPCSNNVRASHRTADTSSESTSGSEFKRQEGFDNSEIRAIREEMAEMRKAQQSMEDMQRQVMLELWSLQNQFVQQYGTKPFPNQEKHD